MERISISRVRQTVEEARRENCNPGFLTAGAEGQGRREVARLRRAEGGRSCR